MSSENHFSVQSLTALRKYLGKMTNVLICRAASFVTDALPYLSREVRNCLKEWKAMSDREKMHGEKRVRNRGQCYIEWKINDNKSTNKLTNSGFFPAPLKKAPSLRCRAPSQRTLADADATTRRPHRPPSRRPTPPVWRTPCIYNTHTILITSEYL